jgi:hypothetical protein
MDAFGSAVVIHPNHDWDRIVRDKIHDDSVPR